MRKKDLVFRGGVGVGYIGLGFISINAMVEVIDKVKVVYRL